jgi:hypothetical protein
MRNEFGFDDIASTEFCVSISEGEDSSNYLIPCDRDVQNALKEMLNSTVQQWEEEVGQDRLKYPTYELSEKHAAKEALVAKLARPEMTTIKMLYEEEGWTSNTNALRKPSNLLYYFAVLRDQKGRKLLAIRQASQSAPIA